MGFSDLFTGIFIPFVMSLFITLIIVWFYTYFVLSFTKKKRIEKAIRDGHVVNARLVRKEYVTARFSRTNRDAYDCWYEYTYNGKKYKKHILYSYSGGNIPEYMELYFETFPRDARDTEDMGEPGKTVSLIIFAVVFAAALLIRWV